MVTMERAARLATDRRFIEAAECALEVARNVRAKQGPNRNLYEVHGAAAKFFHLGGDMARALAQFDECFGVFDTVLERQDSAIFVVQHLRTWPELFSRASFAALDAGDAARAVHYAEIGRARLLGSVMRSGQDESEPNVAAYRRDLNELVLGLASRVFANQGPDPRERATDDALRRRRRQLVQAGASAATLSLAADWTLEEDVARRLSRAEVSTAVLYSISLDSTVRLILIDSHGYREIPFAGAEIVTQALARLALRSRAAVVARRTDLSNELERGFREALEVIRPIWKPVLDKVLGDDSLRRLLWVPHGVMIDFPIAVLGSGEVPLCERLALQVAPSLGVGMDFLASVRVERILPCSIEGPDPLTAGGERIAARLGRGTPTAHHANNSDELAVATKEANLVLFNCHGLFDWSNPFETRLALDYQLSLRELSLSRTFAESTLVVLNSCDAGTVAQSNINEAVGLPTALLASGAAAAIGAALPVSAFAAAAFSSFVFDALRAGAASPEAVQTAVSRLRKLRGRELRALLSDMGHPRAQEVPLIGGHLRVFDRVVDWGLFQHWGATWQCGSAVEHADCHSSSRGSYA